MKKKNFRIYRVMTFLLIIGIFLLCGCNKTDEKSSNDNINSTKKSLTVEEDVEEVTDNHIYVRKTFLFDGKQAKIEYKYENSMYEIKINDNKVKNNELTNGGDYQIEQLKDAVVIAIKTPDKRGELSIYAFDFTGKEILNIYDYVDEEKYMSLRAYGDSAVHNNWAFQITDSTLNVITGRVIAGDIDGISNPCDKSEIAEAKFTNDTMMAAQYSISYLGKSKFSDAKIERVTADYSQYKKIFPCR